MVSFLRRQVIRANNTKIHRLALLQLFFNLITPACGQWFTAYVRAWTLFYNDSTTKFPWILALLYEQSQRIIIMYSRRSGQQDRWIKCQGISVRSCWRFFLMIQIMRRILVWHLAGRWDMIKNYTGISLAFK